MITVNQIYNYIVDAITEERSDLYCASRLEPIPERFPSVQIVELNHIPIQNRISLDFKDMPMRRDFEVHVFSNLKNGALSEARSIMTDVEEAFRSAFFVETYCGQANNADVSVIHMVARFTRNIGDGDSLTLDE